MESIESPLCTSFISKIKANHLLESIKVKFNACTEHFTHLMTMISTPISNVRRERVALVAFILICFAVFGLASLFYNSNPTFQEPSNNGKEELLLQDDIYLSPFIKEIQGFIASHSSNDQTHASPDWKQHLPSPPNALDLPLPKGDIYWKLETNFGPLLLRLHHEWAPQHVAQFGCPKGDGTGNPGYKYKGEFISNEAAHKGRGFLSTANSGPGTDGSQLFIMFANTPYSSLDGKHTVFGELVFGWPTLDEIEKHGSNSGKTNEKIEILKATLKNI